MNIQKIFDAALQDSRSGRFRQAEKKLLRLAKEPMNDHGAGSVYKLLGVVYASTHKVTKAAKAFAIAAEKIPSDPSIYANLCNCLTLDGQFDDAVAAGQRAVALSPGSSDAHYNLADAFKLKGDLGGAVAHYRKTVEISPDVAAAHNSLGNVLWDSGDLDGAISSYRRALEISPDLAIAHNNLGTALRNAGEPENAISSYLSALEIRPDMAIFRNNLGMAYRDINDLENAIANFSQALEIQPDFTSAFAQLGHAHRDGEKYDHAIEYYDRADTGVARAEALRCLYAAGKYDELFDRIREQPDKYGTNIGAAAVCAYAAEQLGQENPHPFCPNPLDFLYFGKIDGYLADVDDFTETLIEELRTLPSVWNLISTTTESGFQTRGNLFDQNSENIRLLQDIIEKEIETYRSSFDEENCLFIKSWPAETDFNAWSVILRTNGHQSAHIHASGWLSGVVYLKLVASDDKDEGAIIFGSDGYGYPLLNSDVAERLHRPEKGEIVLFPSSLFHRTVPITRDGERIIVAFDLVPREQAPMETEA